jgi:hypothetical protein
MWMQIYNGEEIIYEQYIEPESTYKHTMTGVLNMEMRNQIESQRRQIAELTKELARYQKFAKKIPSLWEEFKRTEAS